MDNDDKNYIEKIEEIQKSMPDIILPNMGLIDNSTKIDLDGSDYIKECKEK